MPDLRVFLKDNFDAYKNIPSRPTYKPNGEIREEYKEITKGLKTAKEKADAIADTFSKGTAERKALHKANQKIFDIAGTSKQNAIKNYKKKALNYIKNHKITAFAVAGALILAGILTGKALHNKKSQKQ